MAQTEVNSAFELASAIHCFTALYNRRDLQTAVERRKPGKPSGCHIGHLRRRPGPRLFLMKIASRSNRHALNASAIGCTFFKV